MKEGIFRGSVARAENYVCIPAYFDAKHAPVTSICVRYSSRQLNGFLNFGRSLSGYILYNPKLAPDAVCVNSKCLLPGYVNSRCVLNRCVHSRCLLLGYVNSKYAYSKSVSHMYVYSKCEYSKSAYSRYV